MEKIFACTGTANVDAPRDLPEHSAMGDAAQPGENEAIDATKMSTADDQGLLQR